MITDWKTNQKSYTPLDTYQLPLYAAYIRRQYNKPVIGRLAFLRFNKVEEHLFTDAEINEALDWARETAYECETRKDQVEMGADPLEIFPNLLEMLASIATISIIVSLPPRKYLKLLHL